MALSRNDLECKKLDAEIAKLEAEAAEIKRPIVHRSGFWMAFGPAVVAIGGLCFQYLTYRDTLNLKQGEIQRLLQQVDQKKADADLAIKEAGFVKAKTDWELQQKNEELSRNDKLLADREQRIRQLVEKQFALFGMVCDAAGAIASAENWNEARAALQRFDDPEVTLVKTSEIATAIEATRKRIGELLPTENARPEDLHMDVLAISNACRAAWEKERDVTLGDIKGIGGKDIQRRFKEHHYDQATQVTRRLSQASDWDNALSDRRLFWRLYLGKLVLVENQGANSVARAMVNFGTALRKWENGAPAEELKEELSELAKRLEQACREDMEANG